VEHQKVLLYYGFTPIEDTAAVHLWQRTLCESLGIKGRIIVSPQGINGTVGGEMETLKKYVSQTKKYPGFKKIDFKWSNGTGNEFSKLSVKVKDELVAFGDPSAVKVNEDGVVGGGKHLKPYDVHKLMEERGDEVIFFDSRNEYEAKIGRFKDAIIPNITRSRDFVREIKSGKYDHIKDKPIVAYCTGGIRCEILTAVMVENGFKEVYQIEGGIVKYGQKYGDKGLWEGSLYTFDGRMAVDFSSKTKVIGSCELCDKPTKYYTNCSRIGCHALVLQCEECSQIDVSNGCTHKYSRSFNPDLIG